MRIARSRACTGTEQHDPLAHLTPVHAERRERTPRDATVVGEQTEQDVLGAEDASAERASLLVRHDERLTRGLAEPLEHVASVGLRYGRRSRDHSAVTPLERLTAEDERILRLEDETIAGHTCKIMIVDRPAGVMPLAAVRTRIAQRIARVPRCRQRVVSIQHGREVAPCWCDDEQFSVDGHVRPAALDHVVDRSELLALVGRLMAGRLDRNRPLWSIDVVDPLDDGLFALVWRIHHCIADGMTAMRWASTLLWDDSPADTDRAPSATGTGNARPARGGDLERFRDAVEHGARTAATLARELRPTSASSLLSAPAGTERTIAFARCSLDEMRAVGRGVDGATVNDVLLAVVAGGMRTWLISRGAPLHTIRLKVPVSMHNTAGVDAANRDSFLFVDVPLDGVDPVERLRTIRRETTARKERHDAQTLYSAFDAIGHVAPLGHAVTRLTMSPHVFAVNVSNVPGPRDVPTLLGVPVGELYSLAEIAPHHLLRVAAVSLAGSLFIGLTVDPRAVPDVTVLAAGIEASMAQLATGAG